MNVFISSERVDSKHAAALIEKLKSAGLSVAHSPRNPLDGQDDRWRDWYARGCAAELDGADVFVSVITRGWDSSTWMAIESDEALRRLRAGRIKRMFFYNPEQIDVKAAGMLPYLIEKLPDSPDEAVTLIRRLKVESD